MGYKNSSMGELEMLKTTLSKRQWIAICTGLLLTQPALAYIGPGAGLGAIALTVAVVLGLLFLFFGLVWYPLKRYLRKVRGNDPSA